MKNSAKVLGNYTVLLNISNNLLRIIYWPRFVPVLTATHITLAPQLHITGLHIRSFSSRVDFTYIVLNHLEMQSIFGFLSTALHHIFFIRTSHLSHMGGRRRRKQGALSLALHCCSTENVGMYSSEFILFYLSK